MKRVVLATLAAGVVALVAVVAVRKLNDALEFLGEVEDGENEDLPPGVEGFRPSAPETWIPANLPPEIAKILDQALATFPDGWVKRVRPTRREEEV